MLPPGITLRRPEGVREERGKARGRRLERGCRIDDPRRVIMIRTPEPAVHSQAVCVMTPNGAVRNNGRDVYSPGDAMNGRAGHAELRRGGNSEPGRSSSRSSLPDTPAKFSQNRMPDAPDQGSTDRGPTGHENRRAEGRPFTPGGSRTTVTLRRKRPSKLCALTAGRASSTCPTSTR